MQNIKRMVTALLAAVLFVCLAAQAFITTGEGQVQQSLSAYDNDPEISELQEYLYLSILSHDELIDFSHMPIPLPEFGKIWKDLRYDHPDLYTINSGYTYTYRTIDGIRYVFKVRPHYEMTAEEAWEAEAVWYDSLSKIVMNMNPNWTDTQKALYLHDYIATHYEYDLDYNNYDPYSMLTEGKGVCLAYTMLYKALLEQVAITADYVTSESMNHAWNTVTIGNHRYNVDVTWDDPTKDRWGRVSHEDFLVSDISLSDDHSFTWAEGYGQCTATNYDNAVWTDVNTAFIPIGNKFYFIKNSAIYSWDGKSVKKCREFYSRWYTDSRKSTYWRYKNSDGSYNTCYSVAQPAGNKLLYNSAYAIHVYDPKLNTIYVVYEHRGGGCIYGFTYDGKKLVLQVGDHPNGEFKTITVTNFKKP